MTPDPGQWWKGPKGLPLHPAYSPEMIHTRPTHNNTVGSGARSGSLWGGHRCGQWAAPLPSPGLWPQRAPAAALLPTGPEAVLAGLRAQGGLAHEAGGAVQGRGVSCPFSEGALSTSGCHPPPPVLSWETGLWCLHSSGEVGSTHKDPGPCPGHCGRHSSRGRVGGWHRPHTWGFLSMQNASSFTSWCSSPPKLLAQTSVPVFGEGRCEQADEVCSTVRHRGARGGGSARGQLGEGTRGSVGGRRAKQGRRALNKHVGRRGL